MAPRRRPGPPRAVLGEDAVQLAGLPFRKGDAAIFRDGDMDAGDGELLELRDGFGELRWNCSRLGRGLVIVVYGVVVYGVVRLFGQLRLSGRAPEALFGATCLTPLSKCY